MVAQKYISKIVEISQGIFIKESQSEIFGVFCLILSLYIHLTKLKICCKIKQYDYLYNNIKKIAIPGYSGMPLYCFAKLFRTDFAVYCGRDTKEEII